MTFTSISILMNYQLSKLKGIRNKLLILVILVINMFGMTEVIAFLRQREFSEE